MIPCLAREFPVGWKLLFQMLLAFCLQNVSIQALEFKYLTFNKNKTVFQKQSYYYYHVATLTCLRIHWTQLPTEGMLQIPQNI